MTWLLLAIVQTVPPVTPEEVRALVERLPASRAEIVALGPGVLRLLAESGPRERVADVMFELKCAGAPQEIRRALEKQVEMREGFVALDDVDGMSTPIIDFGLPREKRTARLVLNRETAPLHRHLARMLAPHGLEFAIARGRIVVSTPERLWSYPPGRSRALTSEEVESLRAQLARLGDESVIMRGEAATGIAALGPSARPYLEEALKTGDYEAGHREEIVALLRRIEARERPAPFARGLALERQTADELDAIALRAMREKRTTLAMVDAPLGGVVSLVARSAGLGADVPAPQADARVTVAIRDVPVVDALYFLLASFDLDAALVSGKVTIGTPEAVAKLLRSR